VDTKYDKILAISTRSILQANLKPERRFYRFVSLTGTLQWPSLSDDADQILRPYRFFNSKRGACFLCLASVKICFVPQPAGAADYGTDAAAFPASKEFPRVMRPAPRADNGVFDSLAACPPDSIAPSDINLSSPEGA